METVINKAFIDWEYLLSEARAVLKARSKKSKIYDIEEKALDLVVLYLDYKKKPNSTPFRLMWSLASRLNYIQPLSLEEHFYKQEKEKDAFSANYFLSSFSYRHLFFMWGQLLALSCNSFDDIKRCNKLLEKYIPPRSIKCEKSALNCNYSTLPIEEWINTRLTHAELKPLQSYCIFEWGITGTSDLNYFLRYGLPRGELLQTIDM